MAVINTNLLEVRYPRRHSRLWLHQRRQIHTVHCNLSFLGFSIFFWETGCLIKFWLKPAPHLYIFMFVHLALNAFLRNLFCKQHIEGIREKLGWISVMYNLNASFSYIVVFFFSWFLPLFCIRVLVPITMFSLMQIGKQMSIFIVL